MKPAILDASAMMTFYESRPGANRVEELLHLALAKKRDLFMCIVNWGEVYYSTWRTLGEERARQIAAEILHLPISLVIADRGLTQAAAEIRSVKRLPYMDSFVAALAVREGGVVITSDSDFSLVKDRVAVNFL